MNDLQPIALAMPMNRELEDFYWLYWRIYETVIPKPAFRERFGRNNEILRLFQLALHMRLLAERDEDFRLTERGAFWVHLLQNYYVLNYINKVWTACMRRPWPRSIEM